MQYFYTAAKEQHFTRAANKLNISQPTLSASISRLEDELGCQLFNRKGRQVLLNENGEILLKHAQTILQSYQDAVSELEALRRSNSNVLNIACMTVQVHSKYLRNFRKKHPEIKLFQKILLTDGFVSTLNDNENDFIIANILISNESLAYILLADDPLYLAVSRDHPISQKETYSVDDLINEHFVIVPGGSGFMQIFEALFTANHYPIPQVDYAFPSEWQKYINKGYLAISTEEFFYSGGFDSSVVFLPPEDPACHRKQYLVWNKDKPMTKAAKLFQQTIKNDYHL
ncbi:MAG: LysR family transcriptional regulator [Clostridiales bacterium]|nr:LysR family transcriptional regulator [Clostridiales bacterium]